jgi:hypothetical protein
MPSFEKVDVDAMELNKVYHCVDKKKRKTNLSFVVVQPGKIEADLRRSPVEPVKPSEFIDPQQIRDYLAVREAYREEIRDKKIETRQFKRARALGLNV